MSPVRPDPPPPRGRHRYAVVLACCVVVLIAAGALVTSREAGLAVPDWPLSYGMVNPPGWTGIANVRAEHGHRLIAGTVALLTVGLAVWFQRRERRRWVRRLAWGAVVAVFAQALLGGLTVLFFLPTPISVSHAGLAQLFLCMVVGLGIATSASWREGAELEPGEARAVAVVATATTAAVYLQILVGAVMRHSGAGLAIPDFPLAFGALVPPYFDFPIAIHYAHRVGALVVATLVFWTCGRTLRFARGERRLVVPAVAAVAIVLLQGGLGAAVVLTRKAVYPNTLHVATGAVLLAVGLVLTLRAWRFAWLAERRREPVRIELGAAPPRLQRVVS